MSTQNRHRLGEVIVSITCAPGVVKTEANSEATPSRSFNAFIYSDFDIENAAPPEPEFKNQCGELRGLPLVAVEKLVVNWSYYRKHTTAIISGASEAKDSLNPKELFTEISPGLASLFRGRTELKKLRIWWNVNSTSLLKLPWELLTYDADKPASLISLVRGLPPSLPVPKLPAGDKLRLAFIHEPSITPPTLSEALKDIKHIELIDMSGDPLAALQEAIEKDYELIHFVCDGSLSFADEGYLYLRRVRSIAEGSPAATAFSRLLYRAALSGYQTIGPSLPKTWYDSLGEMLRRILNIETLSAAQLSALQRGSQLAVLSLTPPDEHSGQGFDSIFLPSVFSAFAAFGGSSLPMPNIVAQIDTAAPERLASFWRNFYTELGESLEIEKAHSLSMHDGESVPVALFLRQRYRQTFKRETAERDYNVPLINAELQLSQETWQQLKGLSGFEEIVSSFEQQTQVRQQELQAKLSPWLEESDESEIKGASS
jgi:hypothetical protein